MKFRGGVIGFRSGGQTSSVERTSQSTGTDAEIGLKNFDPKTTTTSPDGASIDEKIRDSAIAGSHPTEDGPVQELQYGVQLAEASVKVWTKEHLILAYIL